MAPAAGDDRSATTPEWVPPMLAKPDGGTLPSR
jgi:hypothetical protein